MQNIKDVFDLVKFLKFLENYTSINPTGGIRHRITGNGTNKTDKNKGLTDKDKEGLKDGLVKFVADVQNVIDNS